MAGQDKTNTADTEFVYVFQGAGHGLGRVSGVFTTFEKASEWIAKHKLAGTLSQYVLDDPSYDRAQTIGRWKPTRPEHFTAEHIEDFSPPDRHWHFANGAEG